MDYKKGDEILIKATVKFADECGGMVLAQTDGGEECDRGFYVNAASILHGGDADKTYEEGLADAWEVARRIVIPPMFGGFNGEEMKEIFDGDNADHIFIHRTIKEVMEAVKYWEDMKAREIHVGDVVVFKDGGKGNTGVVTAVYKDTGTCCLMWQDGVCGGFFDNVKLEKTGRHIDIEALLSQIGGES